MAYFLATITILGFIGVWIGIIGLYMQHNNEK
jgi:hypothetical protein